MTNNSAITGIDRRTLVSGMGSGIGVGCSATDFGASANNGGQRRVFIRGLR
jgi:hypothetical protein